MGNTQVPPASDREVEEHFVQYAFSVSRSCDIEKLKGSISNLRQYVGVQIHLQKDWEHKHSKPSDLSHNKKFVRKGIPDTMRRLVFLAKYELDEDKCKEEYEEELEKTNKEILEIMKEDKPALTQVPRHYLNDHGLENLETVIYLLNKECVIEYAPMLINAVAFLLIYLPVDETYCVAKRMMESSLKLCLDPTTKKHMRWHFSFTKAGHFHMLNSFIRSYIDTTRFKTRSILVKLHSIRYDINELLDEMFKYFFSTFLSADHAIDIFTFYYAEGVKVLFRFANALMRNHKDTIKSVDDPEKVHDVFQEATLSKTDWNEVFKYAFSYKLTSKNFEIYKNNRVLDHEEEEFKILTDFLPNVDECPSTILSMKQFYRLWVMLPECLQVRTPKLVYSSVDDEQSLTALYDKLKPYNDKNLVKCVFLTIRTTDHDIFGIFLDAIIYKTIDHYIGSGDSFLYGFYEDKHLTHFCASKNNHYCHGGPDYLQFGGGVEGAAIYIKESLQEGQTNPSDTFGNDILTSNREKFFQIEKIEVIMI